MREPLTECLVDGDADAIRQCKGRRRRAMLVSLVLEGVALMGLLVWPMLTPGTMPPRYILSPLPPYQGGGGHRSSTPPASHQPSRHACCPILIFPVHPTIASTHLGPTEIDGPPLISIGEGQRDGGGDGPGVPWGSGNAVPIVRPPEPTPPVRPTIIRKSEGAMLALLVQRVEPVYPPIAINTHLTGVVRLQAVISTDGTIERLRVVSGNPILAQAAQNAVQQWRYQPARLNGQPVEVETFITVNFVLGR